MLFEWLEHQTHVPALLLSALTAGALILLAGVAIRARIAASGGGIVPDEGISLRNVFEYLVEMLVGLAEQNIGEGWRKYFPIVGTIFFFILISNLMGLVPGLEGATTNANTTWAWAVISFVTHQYVGIKEHGFGYIKHFLGPGFGKHHIPLLAPVVLPIELLSHVSRVFTLAVRLLANMFADHLVVSLWITLVAVGVPAIFMGLGLMVCFLQAYVFTMLSMIYIGLALEDAH
jgi:F-type H+-transporting ATPase subunit a